MKSSKEVAELIKKYIEGKISSRESDQLNNWIKEKPEHETFFKDVLSKDELFEDAFLWIDLQNNSQENWLGDLKSDTLQKIHKGEIKTIKRWNKKWIYYAASIFLIASIGLGLFYSRQNTNAEVDAELSSVLPGTNKAELTLSNGKRINLRTDKDGIIINESLAYSDGTPLLSISESELSKMSATVHVPKGGKYQVTLPDGSKVWLNSMSKLEYPLAFKADKRSVKIEGEGYFEVTKQSNNNKRVPFEVISKTQTIEVTGTEFNISAYPDDSETISTLVEGSINVHTSEGTWNLKPNEQSINSGNKVIKKEVDVSSYIAWKSNKFLFYETELRDVMKGLSRWYDIEVSYQGNIPSTYFYGEIGRDKNLAEVMRMIEKSGVKFKLKQTGKTYKLLVIQ